MSELSDALLAIQSGLKAPKGQYNKFGGYAYRSCEDILEALKPLAVDNGVLFTVSDSIVEIAGRVYVRATAKAEGYGESVECDAYAREALARKGMDESQITGSASSYARKYALNGLLLIDDAKDADTMARTENLQEVTARCGNCGAAFVFADEGQITNAVCPNCQAAGRWER